MGLISSIIVGCLAGYIASTIRKGRGSGCLINLILGVVGSAIGNIIFAAIGLAATGFIGELIAAVIGACVLLWLVAKLK